MINVPKGTKDVLPDESYKWQYVEGVAREIADSFCIKEIRTPIFEHTELFLRGVGNTTDIVNKEMYTFLDKGMRSVTLKPEGTAGVARSFVENGLYNTALPMKSYYFSPVFRYENPQHGRLREHHQFGVEYYGSALAKTDCEIILIAETILKRLGLSVKLNINSLGCPTCRGEYNKALKEFLGEKIENLCPTCKTRYEKNPLRILDCKEGGCIHEMENAPKITDFLCDGCSDHFEELKSLLIDLSVDFSVNPRIVRGLDYYTKTVFEFVSTNLGAQGTVCAGGRYDGLVSSISDLDFPAVGFGMGIERILLLMEKNESQITALKNPLIYFASMGENASKKAFLLAYSLREKNIKVEVDHMQRGIKAQFKYADKIKAEYVATIGDNELIEGLITLKRMKDGKFIKLGFDDFLNIDSLMNKISQIG